MFEAKGPGEYTTRVNISVTGQDEHLDQKTGNVYFYDQNGNSVFAFSAADLPSLVRGGHWSEHIRTNTIASRHHHSIDTSWLARRVTEFKLNNPWFGLGLERILLEEYKKWAYLAPTPNVLVQFLRLTKRGEKKSAVMTVWQATEKEDEGILQYNGKLYKQSYSMSSQELQLLKAVKQTRFLDEASRLVGHDNFYIILRRFLDRNEIDTAGSPKKTLARITNKFEQFALFEDSTIDRIQKHIDFLHDELRILPAHVDNSSTK